jgi:hypothetical protein
LLTRAITRDEAIYESPEEFTPEHFLKEGETGNGTLDPDSYVFGFGRRCAIGAIWPNTTNYVYDQSLSWETFGSRHTLRFCRINALDILHLPKA